MKEVVTKFKKSTRKGGFLSFVGSLVDRTERAVYEECTKSDWVLLNFAYASGTIEVFMTNQGVCRVDVIHASNEHRSPMLEMLIAGLLKDWSSVYQQAIEDKRNEEEFQDYLWKNCRYS